MMLAQVIALDLTLRQANQFARAAGVSRFTYNWGLDEWERQYAAGLKPNVQKLKKQFNAIKGEKFPWIYESPRDANSQPFADLGQSFANFFASCRGERKGAPVGYPTKRKKGQDDAFYVANDKFRFHNDGQHVILPVIGSVRIHESLRLKGKIVGARVRRIAGRWYISVQVDADFRVPNAFVRPIAGVDLGLKTALSVSNGECFNAPKPLKKNLKRLRRANRCLHRRQKGGKNRAKARRRVARIHQHIANVRHDFMHKVTTQLCRENQTVVIEDLHVKGMLRNEKLARAISDVGFGMFRRFLEYKRCIYGTEIVVADRWFPSSKRCNRCGNVKESLTLSERIYECSVCGLVEDRDRNASLNLEAYPWLTGNAPKGKTPRDDRASTRRAKVRRASAVAELGTKP